MYDPFMYDRRHEWLSTQASELARFVLELSRHDTSAKLPAIGSCLTVVLREQGESHPVLFELARLVAELKRSLLDHYGGREGEVLVRLASIADVDSSSSFAAELDEAGTGPERSEAWDWSQALAEHPSLVALLKEIRRVSFDFSLPPGTRDDEPGVAHLKDLYSRLRDLEVDVRRHIYIEEQMIVPLLAKEPA